MHLKAGTEEDPTKNGKVVALSLRGRKMGWASDTKAVMWSGIVPGLWKMSCRPTKEFGRYCMTLAHTAISNSLENPTM